ncbi:Peptidyl-prolyl cis-trans isomerase FKBP65, partial [Bienertia sinuspersici]
NTVSPEQIIGDLCFSHFEEENLSSNSLLQIVCQLDKNQSLKEEGNSLYKQGLFALAIEKYFLAIKVLSFFSITSSEEKQDFLPMAISINLNLATYFLKEENFFRVALRSKKSDLAFFDIAQALKINPYNKEFLLTFREVVTTLGWTKDYVTDALEVLNEEECFLNYTINTGFDVKDKDG